ncbi:MAG: CHASE2 domain-containing protein [Magnetovibrionaceae bacterium]
MFSIQRVIGFLLLIGFVVLQVADPEPIQFARVKVFDFYQQIQPRDIPPAEQKPVTIIDLDEESLAEVGQWPWPRTVIAQMVQNLFQMGAGQVAFDVVFAEPDRMNPENVIETMYGLDDDTKARIAQLPGNDAVLANIVKQTPVVLGQAAYWEELDVRESGPVKRTVALLGPEPHAFLPSFRSLVRNVETIEQAANAHGIFSLVPEPDGIVRRVPTLFAYDGDLYPSLTVEMLRMAFGRPTIAVQTDVAGVKAVKVAPGAIFNTDNKGRVWPYFSQSDRAKYVSAKDVLNGTAAPELIKGKLTIVGTSAVGLLDIRSTPVDPIMPGVEVHVQLIEALLTGKTLTRPNNVVGAELFFTLLGGLLMIALVPMVGALWTLFVFLAMAGGAAGTSWYFFSEELVLVDAIYPVLAIFILYVVLNYVGFIQEERSKKQVRSAFSHYLSPDMVERLAENPDDLKLGGEMREMTMLFCDVRGFTTISEQFDAVGLTQLINKLLTPLTNEILERRGTVDKYMGDCIMAFWNAPLDDEQHARNGCISALAMLDQMGPLNDRLEQEAIEEGRKHIPLKVGLGLNSGPAVVGNMGSEQRFDYSVLGDTVNTASRLEGQSKAYGVNIVIGESTYAMVPDLAVVELDLIKVKGKTEALAIFALLGDDQMGADPAFLKYREHHDTVVASYRGQDWRKCREEMAVCRKLCLPFYDMGGYYDMLEERIKEYVANPPPKDWDGVFVATSK